MNLINKNMTDKEFEKVRPRKTVVKIKTDDGEKILLVKFFLCYTGEDYDGYWMCCTEDMSNPYPDEIREDDWQVYANNAEIVEI